MKDELESRNKVLIFVQDGVGGAERMTALIGKSLEHDKFDVCFCLIERNCKSSIADFIPREIRKIKIPNSGTLFLIWNMAKALIKERPDIVFSSVFNLSNKLLLLKWLIPHAKFIIRCDNYMYTYSDRQRSLLKITYPKADILIAQTEEMGAELIEQAGVASEKVKVLHNPIDKALIDSKLNDSRSPYPDNGKKHFIAVGRFSYQKGFDILIESFNKVVEKRKDVDLYIVGDTSIGNGKVLESVINRAREAGISDLVHLCGYQDNPFPYIKYADCFVLSSRWEGLPNVLIEALYLGTPVAVFKCIPIIERIVKDSIEGYLAKKDDVESLSIAMAKAVDLGRVTYSYRSAEISEFTGLFK